MKIFNIFLTLAFCLFFGGGSRAVAAVPDDYDPENPSEPGAIEYCRVSVSASPQEGAYVSGAGRYVVNGNNGSQIYISTNARNDANYTYNFLYWTLNGIRTSYGQSFYFTPAKGRFEFVAHYEKVDTPYEPEDPAEPSTNVKRKYYLYLTSNVEGACSFSMASGTKVPEQSQQYVTVYPNADYRFDGWKINGVLVSTERYYNFTMPSANTTLEACFTEIPFDPDSPTEPSSQGGEVDNSTRKLINLSIGTVNNNVDKTRIAINEAKTLGYDEGTDATKFVSNDADFQIYSLDAQKVKYSVNERPVGDGIIPLGVIVKKAGLAVIQATRLDCTAFLVDNVTGNWTDLSVSSCTFESEAGTFDNRFYIKIGSIESIPQIKIDNKSREYGEENPEWTYTVESGELIGKPALSSVADKQSPVGTYPIIASKGTIEGGYSFTEGTLTITKAPLNISVGTYTIKEGEAIPEFTVVYEGFKNNETKDVLKKLPIVSCAATANSAPGNYPITLSDAEAMNYEIGYTVGQLTITERKSYTLTYVVNGTTYKTVSIKEGTAIKPETEPTKEGYTFSGWSEIPETMPAKDVTITGSFTVNKYKLVYKVDGEEYKILEVEYGAAITPEAVPMKEGYTFSGWSEIPEKMPARDVTVTGTFTINKYKLVYKVDDVDYKSYEIEYSAAISAEAEPVKEGYSFSGWSLIPETMPAHDVIVTGTFTKGAYKLIYVVDGATYKTISYDYAVAITPEAVPTKEGYTFSGWSEIPETMPAKDVTVTGTFTINKYKLVYKVDDVDYKSYEIEFAAAVSAEAEPVKEGYSFSGWSLIPETMPAHDVTVNGSFTINNYKLVYKVDGVTYKTVSCDYAVAITPEAVPTKEGYTFSGWSEIPETMPAKDVTVTGTFTINKYKLVYKVDGEEYKTLDVEYGAVITPEAVPMKEGYTFSGWSEIPETMPAKDVTVTGTFTINKYKLVYKVDGVTYKTVSCDYAVAITPEAVPTKEGYTFSGWSEIPETMPAKDVTVTGTFTINKYKLVYKVDGEEYKSLDVEYGAAITPEAAPADKEGYTFSGWSEIPETMPAKDVTVTGTFTVNKYKITYMIDNEVYKVVEYEYGATITPEPQPEGDYSSFEWIGLPETMPAKDIVVQASYEVSGIIELMVSQGKARIFSPSGKAIGKLQKGLNIVVLSDGTIRKMVIK